MFLVWSLNYNFVAKPRIYKIPHWQLTIGGGNFQNYRNLIFDFKIENESLKFINSACMFVLNDLLIYTSTCTN